MIVDVRAVSTAIACIPICRVSALLFKVCIACMPICCARTWIICGGTGPPADECVCVLHACPSVARTQLHCNKCMHMCVDYLRRYYRPLMNVCVACMPICYACTVTLQQMHAHAKAESLDPMEHFDAIAR